MGHRHRPKGPRSNWEPKLAFNADRAAHPAAYPAALLPTDTAIPETAVSKALERVIPEPGGVSGRDDAALDAALPLAALIPPVTVPPAAPVTGTPAPAAGVTAPVTDAPARSAQDGAEAVAQVAVAPVKVAAAEIVPGDGLVDLGSTIARYMRDEGEAAVAHLRALSGAGSPAELMRLQMGEVRRAADASLTCWSDLARKASRLVAFR